MQGERRASRVQATEIPPTVEGRVPPHDIDAERAVLSAIFLDSAGDPSAHRLGALDTVIDLLKPDHFYVEAHRRIYEAALDLHSRSQPVDSVQIGGWLKEHDRLAQVGGVPYLAQVVSAAPVVLADHVRAYAKKVVDTWRVRMSIITSQRFAAHGYIGYAEEFGSAEGYITAAAEAHQQIAQDTLGRSTMEPVLETVKRVVGEVTELFTSGRTIAGRSTGFDRYDRVTSGLHSGDLTVVAARPGMGKTSLIMQMAVNIARGNVGAGVDPFGVGIFSLEMPKEQLVKRMIACEAKLDVAVLRSGQLSAQQWSRFTNAATEIAKMPIFIDDGASLSVMELRAKLGFMGANLARTGRKRIDGSPVIMGLAVVDYLQLMKGKGDEGNRELEIAGISRGLKGTAKDLKLPVVAASQLNRAVETRSEKNKRPQLADLRESGAIEQDCDNVCFIYRDDYYTKDQSAEPNIAELIIAKQRNGPTTTVKVRFDKTYTRFDNLADGEFEGDEPDQRTGAR